MLVVAPGHEALVESLGLAEPHRVPDLRVGSIVNEGLARNVQRIERDGDVWYLKVYLYPWRRPRRLFTFTYRKNRARTEYEALAHLQQNGVPVVEPVAYGSHRLGPIIRSCFLLTRGAPGVDGDAFLADFFARPRDDAWCENRRRFLDAASTIVRDMHAVDLFDYDLKFRNILVDERPDGVTLRLLDFPKGQVIPPSRPGPRRAALVWDLATLDKHAPTWFSRSERLRWFVRYLGRPLDADARALLRDVHRARLHLLKKRT